jgi:uncharacterized protein (TIGR00251 family)
MPDITDALFSDRQGVVIAIEVTAGAKADSFPAGYNEWRKAVGCRVTAPAVSGKANRAVLALIADTLGVSRSSVALLSGSTSSQKKVCICGIAREEVLEKLHRNL